MRISLSGLDWVVGIIILVGSLFLGLYFAYRGLWGTLILITVLFSISAFTRKTETIKLEKTTINWSKKFEQIKGLSDWRFQWLVLTIATILIYIWLS